MKQKSKTILILATIAIVGIGAIAFIPGLQPLYIPGASEIYFYTTPGSCTVTMTGYGTKISSPVANTPLKFVIDSTYAHSVPYTVSKTGYISKTGTCVIPEGQRRQDIHITLTPTSGTTTPVACFSTQIVNTYQVILDAICSEYVTQYRWDFENDGTWDTAYSSSTQLTHTFTAGTHIIKLGVTDGTNTDTTTRSVTIQSTTPGTHVLTVTVSSSTGVVAGATVKSSGVSKITSPSGVASLTVPSGVQVLSVSAQGYMLYVEDIDVTGDMQKAVTLTLIDDVPPGVDINITVIVQTTTGIAIEGAYVTIGGVYSAQSDATGLAAIIMPSGIDGKTLTVTARGYTTWTTTIYPTGDQEVTIQLTQAKSIPGFDMILLIGALGIVVITLLIRKKKT